MSRPRRQTEISDSHARFRELALEAVELGRRDGLEFVPFLDPALPHFTKLNESGRAHALWTIEQLVSIGNELHRAGVSLTDSKRVVWSFLRVVKMVPPSDLLDKFESGDVIDIYNEHHQMIFADPIFLSLMSYSLEDLYCRPWTELLGRDEPVFGMIVEAINGILSGKVSGVVDMSGVPECISYEIDSPKRLSCFCKSRFMSPLFDQGRPVAYLCVNRIRPRPN